MKRFITALAICALLLGSATAYAATRTWDDGYPNDHLWSSANNWRLNFVPGDSDNAVIDEDSTNAPEAPYTVELKSDETIASLTMGDGEDAGQRVTLQLGDSSTDPAVTLTVNGAFTVDTVSKDSYVEVSRVGTGACKVSALSFVISGDANYTAEIKVTGGAKIETTS